MEREIILRVEPCSALDPIATAKVEGLLEELRGRFTIAMVTRSRQQAARVSQRAAYWLGRLAEVGATALRFETPQSPPTRDSVQGRVG